MEGGKGGAKAERIGERVTVGMVTSRLVWLTPPLPQDKCGGCESPSEHREMRLGSQDPNGDVSLHISL